MAMRINGNLQLAGVVGGDLEDRPETWDRGVFQESMGMTLAETHSSGDVEAKEATSSSQAGTPLEE